MCGRSPQIESGGCLVRLEVPLRATCKRQTILQLSQNQKSWPTLIHFKLAIVNSNYGVTVVCVIPMNFMVPLADSFTKSHEVQVVSLSTLHHKSARVRAQVLTSHIDGSVAFEFSQCQRGGSIIEFVGSASHVCSPAVVCVEGDDHQTRK